MTKYQGEAFLIKNAVIYYPVFFEPREAAKGGKKQYSCALVLEAENKQVTEIVKRAQHLMRDHESMRKKTPKQLNHFPLKKFNNDNVDEKDNVIPDWKKNKVVLSTKSNAEHNGTQFNISVVDRDGKTKLTKEDGKLLSNGQIANVYVKFKATSSPQGLWGISCFLSAVQFVELGSGTDDSIKFEPLAPLENEEVEEVKEEQNAFDNIATEENDDDIAW